MHLNSGQVRFVLLMSLAQRWMRRRVRAVRRSFREGLEKTTVYVERLVSIIDPEEAKRSSGALKS